MLEKTNLETLGLMLQAQGKLGPGRIFWVGGGTAQHRQIGASDNNTGLDPLAPLSTLDYAVSKCTAGRGDNIVLMPGFSEDLTAAADIDLDVADITVWGLGKGSSRPTITCSGTTDTLDMDIDAANITIHNVLFDMTGNDSVTAFLDVSADADDLTFSNCRFLLGDGDGQVDIGVDIAAAERVKFVDCEFFGDTATSTGINVSGAAVELKLIRCYFDIIGSAGAGGDRCVNFAAAATEFYAEDCIFIDRVASQTATVDANANAVTGMMVRCHSMLGNITTAGSGIMPYVSDTPEGYIGLIECYVVNDQGGAGNAGEAGALVGTAST